MGVTFVTNKQVDIKSGPRDIKESDKINFTPFHTLGMKFPRILLSGYLRHKNDVPSKLYLSSLNITEIYYVNKLLITINCL